ncbi:hypothetical protein PHYSODRAFT_338583 [Phytophthora sojae]|uniref:Uncharacterized protein n=1 Tax=Phytophthora sojae (strain P6497) TaxID=1094619 RepID=G5A2H7_PHYSP|nr:hypothetical protein PHYSODRAFT_338583 [Phytophthora sojae]EGZ09868.1 hypothetical protein PHYSODRAFT_338583 [Phytophthora sojae]|eukprot:XP_009534729.1 hypothetical protein PHYSODRAFT_338583 [Phytophthora sojae]
MERKRYFRLVDGARRPQPELGDVPVRYVRVRDGTDAGDFCETVLARCTDSLPPGLIDEAVLKVFVNSEAAGPLNADDALSAYGLNREDPLVVEVPKVWFHLTDAGTQPPFARTSAASVPLTANHTIESLRNAVMKMYSSSRLARVAVSDLQMPIGSLGRTLATALIIEVPQNVGELYRLSIDQEHTSSVQTYQNTAQLLKESLEVKAVVKLIENASESPSPTRFVVLENSSGTGKTQMAFNLQATEACDVFYVLCTPAGDRDQDVMDQLAGLGRQLGCICTPSSPLRSVVMPIFKAQRHESKWKKHLTAENK